MDANLTDFIINSDGLIYSVIGKYKSYYDIDDLYQAAVMGIVKASKNYNVNYNSKFATYAYTYMVGEVISFVNNNRSIKLSREIIGINKKINEARSILTQKLMKEPTSLEIALFLEMDEKIIDEVIIMTKESDSLDRIICEDGKNILLMDTIKSEEDYYNVDNMLLREEMNKLPEEERKVLEFRYFQDKTQQEIAEELGIYQVQVSRNEQRARNKLKRTLEKTL